MERTMTLMKQLFRAPSGRHYAKPEPIDPAELIHKILPLAAALMWCAMLAAATARLAPLVPTASADPLARRAADPPPAIVSMRVGLDGAVLSALKSMGLSIIDLEAWVDKHPQSLLGKMKFMSADKQRNIARTALFIRRSNNRIDPVTAWREACALVHYSNKYGVPSVLAIAVAHAESTFYPGAVSSAGAAGVMQVMWQIHTNLLSANGIGKRNGANPLGDPEVAIAAGCLLLSRYLRATTSIAGAMERYLGGRSASYQNKITRNIASVVDHHSGLYQD